MSKHTKTPWRYVKQDNIIVSESKLVADVNEGVSPLTAIVPSSWDCSEEERNANAEFIVCACNSHEDLLDACKAIVRRWDSGIDALTEAVEIAAVRAAINKAEGR